MPSLARTCVYLFVLPLLNACGNQPVSGGAPGSVPDDRLASLSIRLLRNATLVIDIDGKTILVDPMLGEKGAYDAFAGAGNDRRNPLVDLPLDAGKLAILLGHVDAVLITHTHSDHWDAAAQRVLRKDLPVFVQPADEARLREQGFVQVTPIDTSVAWQGLTIHRTGGQHGLDELGRLLGPVSGYVVVAGHASIYLAGDTRWVDEVRDALDRYQPTLAVLNAGGAEFIDGPLAGGPITMTAEDVVAAYRHAPNTRFIAVHMDALNHCPLTRDALRAQLESAGLLERIEIPLDGETIQAAVAPVN